MREWLKTLRISKGLNQQDVAKLCDISNQYYSMIENGDRNPSPKTAQAIANVLGFNWTRFFEPDQEAS
ncbi:MAG TPA: helix-turn-helix transcriptional regulator [Candidatus Eisenbacteria bacterium]|nr:helix-turn-helix transcriptional regulator [Candidatus Eisenbacteria bacterium]